MKAIRLLILFSVISSCIAKNIDLGTTNDPYTKEDKIFLIDSSRLENLPTWDGTSDNFPLSLNDAFKLARKKAFTDHSDKLGEIKAVFLVPRHLSTGQTLWAYTISFRLADTESHRSISYLVLLDGTVVSAVPKRQAQQDAAANP